MHYAEFELNHTWAVKYNTARPRNRYMSPAGHTYETFQLLIRARKNMMKPKDPRANFLGGYIVWMVHFIKLEVNISKKKISHLRKKNSSLHMYGLN